MICLYIYLHSSHKSVNRMQRFVCKQRNSEQAAGWLFAAHTP